MWYTKENDIMLRRLFMDSVTQRAAAKTFLERWNGIGDEKQDTQSYWIDLLSNVYGVNDATNYISFEKE